MTARMARKMSVPHMLVDVIDSVVMMRMAAVK